jgi:hypothetical protein
VTISKRSEKIQSDRSVTDEEDYALLDENSTRNK